MLRVHEGSHRTLSKRRHDAERSSTTPAPAVAAGPAPGAALAAWAIAGALIALHGVFGLVPTMHAWALNLDRFLNPIAGWGLWALAAVALTPAVGRPLARWLARAGDALVRAPGRAGLFGALVAATLALALPDRVRFVGDFLLRLNTLEAQAAAKEWYPQALPLDLFLHDTVVNALSVATGLGANGASRVLGAVEAGILAALAVQLPRVLDLSGASALVAAAALFWGGDLTLFTGFDKAFSELCVVAAALGVFGLGFVRAGTGLVPFGIALALGLTLHRSAPALLPGALVVWWLGWRYHRPPAGRLIVGVGLPILALALMLPRITRIVSSVDTSMHLAPEELRAHGFWAATFGAQRLLDLANLVLMLSPLALVALLGPWVRLERRVSIALAALTLPMLLSIPFIHPGQGYLRDWDDFAAAGVLASLAAAVVLGAALRSSSRHEWVALGLVLALAVPSLQWLLHQTDLARGLRRARAFMTEPPPRTDAERYSTWMYLGVRNAAADHYAEAAAAYREAAAVVPSPHVLRQWAIAETMSGDLEAARAVYRRLLARNPDDAMGWLGLAVASYRLHDWDETRHAARELLQRDPTQSEARRVLEELDRLHLGGDGAKR